ncbi:hypothetical protein niasHT_010620 [Heterodera trifolii]|uniref:Uncharacterized protein n=1 Tax=Heterodera trifolii TaxID=157864 RepID=A0ABD2LAC4_9BILA
MGEKVDANGTVKRTAWHNNKDLVLPTILDPRFKLSNYLDPERHDEYTRWLIDAAETVYSKDERTFDDDVQNYPDAADEISNNLFTEFEQEMNLDNFLLASPIPSPAVLNARQKSEAK